MYVHVDIATGRVLRVYTYRDDYWAEEQFPDGFWIEGENPLFRHADDPERAFEVLRSTHDDPEYDAFIEAHSAGVPPLEALARSRLR